MAEIIDLDELVPDDIIFKYRDHEYKIPGDLRTEQTLELYALLQRLANAEAKGGAAELKRIIAQTEAALLPVFKVHQPDLDALPFGAAGLGHVLRRILSLIGLLDTSTTGDGDEAVPPVPAPAPNRAGRRQTQKTTKRGSSTPTKRTGSRGSSRSKR